MFEIRHTFALTPASIEAIDEFAKTFSLKVQKRVFRNAGHKASEAMTAKIASLVPMSSNKSKLMGKTQGPGRHIRDSVAYKSVSYAKSGRVLFIMGYQSGANPLQTLMEKSNYVSTGGRWTKHASKYKRQLAGHTMVSKRTQRRDGSWRTIRELQQKRDNRRSIGSFATGGKPAYRGHFPRSGVPYAPITRAARELENTIIDIMTSEIASGFEREFAREAGVH